MSASALLLVVEDEAMILMDLEASLQEAGFEVLAAANAEAAMRLYDERGSEIRAVLTDIRLGKGAAGWDVARHARAASPTIPVVYVSGDSAGEWAAQGVPNSIMIPKPYAFVQLATALATLMNSPDQLPSQTTP